VFHGELSEIVLGVAAIFGKFLILKIVYTIFKPKNLPKITAPLLKTGPRYTIFTVFSQTKQVML